MTDATKQQMKVWRVRVLTTTWLSYAGFYFCRKNFAIAKSSLLESLQIEKSDLAHIVSAYLLAYMLGQFLTAALSRRFASRLLLLTGMAISLGCNVVFGFAYLSGPAGYWPLLLFNVINGFAQATGWAGNVGILGNWLSRKERGGVMALWATCYQLGSILAKAFATLMLAVASAAWSFWGAAIILMGVWIIFLIFERDRPEDVGLAPMIEEVEVSPEEQAEVVAETRHGGWQRQVLLSIIFMGATYFVFKFLRYALDSWSPLALKELFNLSEANAGYISTAFDWVGFLGVLFAGWFSDRFFAGRRYQTVVWMTVGMLGAFAFLAVVGVQSVWLFAIGLSLCGFMLMGPDSLLSGVGAIDVAGRDKAVLAAGIINGLGSIGPVFQEEIIGYLLDHHGYTSVFNLLVSVSALGVIATLYLARRSRRGLSSL
ncbi:MAG: MFS transporter [Myxococcota bacterium]|nr:MFS transporter [Myxococcota bacterium]